MKRMLRRFEGTAFTLLRVMTGLLFALHGAQKLFGVMAGSTPPLLTKLWTAGVIEFAGGLLVAAGWFTGPVAIICAGEMAIAYLQAHAPRGLWPVQNGGELALLYCFVFLFIATHGAGPVSVDRK